MGNSVWLEGGRDSRQRLNKDMDVRCGYFENQQVAQFFRHLGSKNKKLKRRIGAILSDS